MTTLISRQTAREAMATLLTNSTLYQTGYDHEPRDMDGQSPVYTIRSGGTAADNTMNISPTTYRFILTHYVLVVDPQAPTTWTAAEAEDKLDELDKKVRELIKDNTPTGCEYWELEDGFSNPGYTMIDGEIYRTEEYGILAGLATGQ